MFSSAPQKVRTNELDCLFGSVIHLSRVFCSGTFGESVSRKILYETQLLDIDYVVIDFDPNDLQSTS